jgi:hypothetical protein
MFNERFFIPLKIFLTGMTLIVLEFELYTFFPFFAKTQLLIMFVTFFLARIAYKDREIKYLYRNQILAVMLGIIYAMFTDVSPTLYASFFYAIITYMTKYARHDSWYILLFSINVMYFLFFASRIIYFVFMQDIVFDFYNIIITNLFVLTIMNSLLCFFIARKKPKQKKKFRHKTHKYI